MRGGVQSARRAKPKHARKSARSRSVRVNVHTVRTRLPYKFRAHRRIVSHKRIPIDTHEENEVIDAFTEGLIKPPTIVKSDRCEIIVPESCATGSDMTLEKIFKEKQLLIEYMQQLRRVNKRNTGFSIAWPQEHFSMLVVARRFSGKSTLIDKLVKEHLVSKRMDWDSKRLMRSELQFFERKVLFAPTARRDTSLDCTPFDEVYTTQADLEEFVAKYRHADENSEFKSTLIVMDDVHTWLDYKSNSAIHWFITVNRHYKCSIIIVAHNIGGVAPSIRNNASEWILFRCKMDEELKKISEAFGTQFDDYYNRVDWSVDYNFLYMTLRRGPVTLFFEGRPKEGIPKDDMKKLSFNEQDVTIKMKYLGKDTLPENSVLHGLAPGQ